MRDIFILVIIAGMMVCAIRKPQCGILAWVWVSVMNPHRLTYGWMYDFPVLDLIAGVTIISVFLHARNQPKSTWQPVLTWLLIFYLWCGLTTIFGVDPPRSFEPWLKFTKSLMPCVFLMLFMNKRHWIIASVAVFVLSIAYFGIKGGLFTLLGDGTHHVYGPDQSSWGDNTGVSIAMLMAIPVLLAMRHVFPKKIERLGVLGAAFCCFFAILGTQSRGGLVGLVGQVLFYFYRSNQKFIAVILVLTVLGFGVAFMPDSWTDRMSTISSDTSKLDESASNRIIQWYYAIDIANERPFFGNGFNSFYYQPYYYEHVAHLDINRAVHSNYFQVLGEQGYIGLIIYGFMWLSFIMTSQKYAKKALVYDDLKWAGLLLQAVQFGFMGYAFNGLTVNMAYLDLPFFLMAFSVLLVSYVRGEIKLKEANNEREIRAPAFRPEPVRALGR